MGAIISTDGDEWDEQNPLIISGHIHEKQRPQENIFYIGAAIQNAFGDNGTPILLHVEIPCDAAADLHGNCKFKLNEIPIQLPKKRNLYAFHGDLKLEEVEAEVKRADTDILRIVYQSTYEDFKIFCKSLLFEQICSFKNVRIVHKMQKSISPTAAISINHISSNGVDFIKSLERAVLEKQDENLYSTFASIVYDLTIDSSNILIV